MKSLSLAITLTGLQLLCSAKSCGQDTLVQNIAQSKKIIERGVSSTIDSCATTNYDILLLDIELDTLGQITHIDLLHKTKSCYAGHVSNLFSGIKAAWKPFKGTYRKVFMPIVVQLNKRDELENKNLSEDAANLHTAQAFASLHKAYCRKDRTVYFSEVVVVLSYSKAKN